MARRPTVPGEPPPPPQLKIPREEAEPKLQDQLTQGTALAAATINSQSDLDASYSASQLWENYTEEVLAFIFTGDKLRLEFAEAGAVWMSPDRLDMRISSHKRTISAKNLVLQSLIQRLPMIPLSDELRETAPATTPGIKRDSHAVFVVHGRNEAVRESLFSFLRAVGLRPMEWTQAVSLANSGAPYIGDILDKAFAQVQAVIILMTPDEEARLKAEYASDDDPPSETDLYSQARPNVLFEAGLAFGRHPERTIIVEIGRLRPFSDVSGRLSVRLNDSAKSRQAFVQRLADVGCPINSTGTDWLGVGEFKV